jgi:hypothetical protein
MQTVCIYKNTVCICKNIVCIYENIVCIYKNLQIFIVREFAMLSGVIIVTIWQYNPLMIATFTAKTGL